MIIEALHKAIRHDEIVAELLSKEREREHYRAVLADGDITPAEWDAMWALKEETNLLAERLLECQPTPTQPKSSLHFLKRLWKTIVNRRG